MKAKIIFVDLNEPVTKEKLEEMLDEAYDQGYNRGYCDGVKAWYTPYCYNYKEIPTWTDTTKTAPKWDQYHVYCDTDIRPMGDIIHS